MKTLKTIYTAAAAALLGISATACTEDSPVTNPPVVDTPVEIERGTFAKGADVSWVTQFEAEGYRFSTQDGKEKELMTLLRDDCGVNAIRLRVWVNPENDSEVQGWCDIDDVVVKARRANELGLRVMIDFHFSDRWADPGQQFIPAAWADMTLDGVKAAMTDHITEMLTKLQRYGVTPEWVQIGNETRTGMMWPLGSLDSGDNFTQMVNTGYDAVKAICPDALVLVHCDQAENRYLYERLFGQITGEGARFDMIGMSIYPEPSTWRQTVDNGIETVKYCRQTFGKPVMIVEVGMDYREVEQSAAMLEYLMNQSIANDVKGIFWWEPETPVDQGYNKGCFDANGAPTGAMDCFKTDTEQ
ncbi:MAG: glycosyl hydrolase 53 family protein [Bacteroidales bacterium]|nr:glycosyl hydrolase 53 family protein [Bacteroidales bacterium]